MRGVQYDWPVNTSASNVSKPQDDKTCLLVICTPYHGTAQTSLGSHRTGLSLLDKADTT